MSGLIRIIRNLGKKLAIVSDGVRGNTEVDKEYVIRSYRLYLIRKILFIVFCIVLMFVVAALYLSEGAYRTTFMQTYETIWNHLIGDIKNRAMDHIIINIRLPTIVEGIIAGAGLAVAGCVMQSVMKNPLADSYTTGISSGASMGAALAIICGFQLISGPEGIVVNAFVFSLIPASIIILVSRLKGASPLNMILSGLAVMYIFNAFTTMLMLSADPEDVAAVYQWEVGTIANASWKKIPVMAAVVFVGTVVLMFLSSRINVLASGDESARSLGVNVNTLRIVSVVIISLMTAAVVSFTGVIGFVGLVCPHITRIFIGGDNRYLIPASAIFGAAFLLVADYIGHIIFAPSAIQVGVITAFVGGPLFLALILLQRREMS